MGPIEKDNMASSLPKPVVGGILNIADELAKTIMLTMWITFCPEVTVY